MTEKLSATTKILIVEHNPDDIELLLEELKVGQLDFVAEIVKDRVGYVNAINGFDPDIILSDYSLPSFNGEEAFIIRQEVASSVPFIFVSGSIGEEKSIEYIKNGVTDYVLKDKLFTISVKVKRALEEAADREEKRVSQQLLAHNAALFERAQQLAHMGSWELHFSDNTFVLSKEGCRIFGLPEANNLLPFSAWSSLVHPDDLDRIMRTFNESREKLADTSYNHRIILKGGAARDIYSESKFELDANGKATGMYGIIQDVTDRNRNESALRDAYNDKITVLERIDDGFFAIDEHSTVTYWNQKAELLLNTRKDEVIGKKFHEVFADSSTKVFYDYYKQALHGRKTIHFREYSERTGKWFDVSAYASNNGLSVYFKDVTETKLAADRLTESELRYRSLNEQATDAICIADAAMRLIDINPYACETFGYSKEQALRLSLQDILFADDLETNPLKITELQNGQTIRNERRLRKMDGTSLEMEVSMKILPDGRLIMFGHDISERKRIELQIRESEVKYRQIVETAQEGIWLVDENNVTTFVNKAMSGILGYSMEEMIGKDNYAFMDEEWRAKAVDQLAKRKLGLNENHDFKYLTKSGKEVWTNISTNPLFNELGDYKGALAMVTDISERKKAEREIGWLINNTEESFILLNKDLEITSFNQKAHTLYSRYLGRELKKGTGIIQYAQPHRIDKVRATYASVLSGAEEMDEISVPVENGGIRNFELKYKPAKDEQDSIIGVFVSAIDITEKKKAEVQMDFERRDKEALINTTTDFMWSVTNTFKLIAANEAFIDSLEPYCTARLQPGDDLLDLEMFPADYLLFWKGLYAKTLSGSSHTEEVYVPAFNGSEASWREVTFNPIHDNNSVTGIACYSRDTTVSKNFQNKLIDANSKLQTAQQIAGLGYWELELSNNTLFWSDEIYGIWGIRQGAAAINLETFLSAIHVDDREVFEKAHRNALDGKEKLDIEHRIFLPSGKIKFVHQKGELLYDPKGNPLRFEGTVQDITQRKELEILLNKANTLARIGSWEVDLEKNTLYWSSITKDIHEVEQDFIPDVQTALNFYKEGESQIQVSEALSLAIQKGIPWDLEIQILTANNSEKWVRSIGDAEFEDGICRKVSGSFQDINERKLAEVHLQELNKEIRQHAKELAVSNAELEQFAYVASHDLQEPLRMITSFLTQLEKHYGPVLDEKGKKYIGFAVGGAKRMRQIILDLLDYSRVGQTEENKTELDLNEVVAEICTLFQKKIEDDKTVITVDTLPHFVGHRAPLHQVFQNLIGNALKYAAADRPCRIHITVIESDTEWQFAVADNGIGISKEYYDRIFIIFQRLHNKDEYSGTGMGLAVTKKIVESLGGAIWVESVTGEGSAFYFTLKK